MKGGRTDRPGRDQPTDQATGRLTVPEAAAALGITADAVRSRIKRRTLQTEREGGRVFVVMGATSGEDTDRARPTNRQSATDPPTDQADDLREQVRYLREQLRREQDAHAEARRIIAGLVQRVPAIDPPAEAPSDAPGGRERTDRTESRGDVPADPETASRRRSLWRRVFGR